MKTPLLSLVIPTLDRYETLIPLVRTLATWGDARMEVIIADNSTNNSGFIYLLEARKNPCFVYSHSDEKLSAVENCDLAVSKARGKYITFIGDDDGVSRKLIDVCKWMEEGNVESVCFNTSLYTWPNSIHAVSANERYNGKLVSPKFSGMTEAVDVGTELEKILQSGAQALYRVPRLYHGVVSKTCLDQLYRRLGTYFPGPVPDMSNAMGLCSIVSRHYFIDAPVIISGHSKKSMSGRNSRREHQGEIKTEPSLPASASETWYKEVPYFWSGPTIWAQACLEGLHRSGLGERRSSFSYPKLYAGCLVFCKRSYHSRVFESMRCRADDSNRWTVMLWTLVHVWRLAALRLITWLRKVLFGISGETCEDISAAMQRTDRILEFGLRLGTK